MTAPRTVVLAVVHKHAHTDTDTVIRAAPKQLPTVSRQAVYDVPRALTDVGLIRRIAPVQAEVFYGGRCPACTAA